MMMTLAEGADSWVEVSKVLTSTGTVGVLVWVLHWLFSKELPRRDEIMQKAQDSYEARITELRSEQVDRAEAYANELKEQAERAATELQRIRETDLTERRAERHQMAEIFRQQATVVEDLVRQVRSRQTEN